MRYNQPLIFIKKLFRNKFIRFVLVGGLNSVFGYGMYALFLAIGLHYTVATLLATIAGVLFNFKTYGILVFKNKSNYLIFRFVLVYIFIYLCNNLFIYCFKAGGIDLYISGAIWLIPGSILSYLLNNIFVYRKQE
ncbi:MAG: GtrA family protein [Bacteroidales bacterium]|jgi:putative flippase GtrA|nr:GtrA family protein [Bacteroidales bacterium]